MTRSVIGSRGIDIRDDCETVFEHNTFILDEQWSHPFSIDNPNVILRNNIIIVEVEIEALILGWELPSLFAYNCLWGIDAYLDPIFDDLIVDPPPTNIEEDPRIDWFVNTPMLAHDSPCIDAGDPDSPADPDGTRTDIGAIAFYQPNSIDYGSIESLYPVSSYISAYPNPFNGTVNFAFSLSQPGTVSIEIFNALGRMQKKLISGDYLAGTRSESWDGGGLPSGDYLIRMTADGQVSTRKVTMIK